MDDCYASLAWHIMDQFRGDRRGPRVSRLASLQVSCFSSPPAKCRDTVHPIGSKQSEDGVPVFPDHHTGRAGEPWPRRRLKVRGTKVVGSTPPRGAGGRRGPPLHRRDTVESEVGYSPRAWRTLCSDCRVASSAPRAAARRRYFRKSMNFPTPSITVRGTRESLSR